MLLSVLTPTRSSGLILTKTLSGIAMSSTLLRKPVKSCIRLKHCVEPGCAHPTARWTR